MFELIVFAIIFSCIIKSKKKKQASASGLRRSVQNRPAQNRPSQNRAVQNKPAQGLQQEMNTTEMLEAKAREDEKEHQLEKKRQQIMNKKHYGHHNYAERYIMGDPVPKGKKMVFCSYCGAENLISTYSAAKDYNCYFCRENL